MGKGSVYTTREIWLAAAVLLLVGFAFGSVSSHFPGGVWSSQDVISFLNMVAAFIAAGATIAIAIVVGKFSRRVAKAEAKREMGRQWQDFNMMIAANKDVAALIAKTEMKGFTADEVRTVYLTFFKVTNLDQISSLKAEGLIDEAWAEKLMSDITSTLIADRKILDFVLNEKGYSGAFVQEIRARLGYDARNN